MRTRARRRPPRLGLRARFEAEWAELEQLLGLTESVGLSGLSVVQIRRAVRLHRRLISAVAFAREQVVDPPLVEYLEQLAARSHVALHGATRPTRRSLRRFVGSEIPRAVRRIAPELAAATVAVALGVLLGVMLVLRDPAWFFALVDDGLLVGHSPAEQSAVLAAGLDHAFAGALLTRAALLALVALALGLVGGALGLVALFAGGTLAGGIGTVLFARGLGFHLLTWAAPHLPATGLAVVLFGAVGLSLGRALLSPQRDPVPLVLRKVARNGAVVLVGATALVLVGLLSRFLVSTYAPPDWARLLIGWVHIIWIALWLFPPNARRRRR